MATFTSLVKERERDLGGFKKASKAALEIFNAGKRSATNKNIERRNAFLEKGKLYTFRYRPLDPNALGYYDKNPLVLVVDRKKINGGYIDIGINLNFLPFNQKLTILNKMVSAYKGLIQSNTGIAPNKANTQKRLPINWEIAKRILGPSAKFALRSYYTSRRSETYCFSYESWKDLIFLDVQDIEGATLTEIYKRKKA